MEQQDPNFIETLFISPSPSPALPDPAAVLLLSRLDCDRNFRLPFRTLRLYSPPPSTSDPARVIAEAIAKALFHFYPLAGVLHTHPNSGHLAVSCSASDSIPLTVANCPHPLVSFQTEPGSEYLNRLAPASVESGRLLALQVTHFACGGLALGMFVHHAICDGAGATKFLSTVAGFARGEDRARVKPVWDRFELLRPRNPAQSNVEFGKFLDFDQNGPYGDVKANLLRKSFHVNGVRLNRFRDSLREGSGLSFTAFEALGSFIWRARSVSFLLEE